MNDPGQRVALVTGAGRGIGLAVVRRLQADGHAVALLDVSERLLDAARESLADGAADALFLHASVTDPDAIAAAVARVQQHWGRLDILVNNAGVNRPGGIFDQPLANWEWVLAVNLTGPFLLTSAAAPIMRDGQWGAIVNIGSVAAAGQGPSPAYASSKAGLLGLTRQTARELGKYNITVNYVAPGVTRTGWVERNLPATSIEASAAAAPLRRVGAPGDIARVVSFLASDDARHVTGQVISPSGGAWMP